MPRRDGNVSGRRLTRARRKAIAKRYAKLGRRSRRSSPAE